MDFELGSSASDWFRFLVAALAVWRLTHLLAREDGPWDLVVRLRRRLGDGFWGRLTDCFQCLSVWVAVPFSFFVGGRASEVAVSWLALSGAAILLEQQVNEPLIIESEDRHELLWSESDEREDRTAEERR